MDSSMRAVVPASGSSTFLSYVTGKEEMARQAAEIAKKMQRRNGVGQTV
jgi:hypothetical protein